MRKFINGLLTASLAWSCPVWMGPAWMGPAGVAHAQEPGVADLPGGSQNQGAFSAIENADFVVLVAFDPACALPKKALSTVSKLSERFTKQSATFYLVNAEIGGEEGSVAARVQRQGLDIPVLMDSRSVIFEALGITQPVEAMVLRSQGWEVVWQGQVSRLSRALKRVVAGRKPPRSTPAAECRKA